MKVVRIWLVFVLCFVSRVRADLTIVQKVEGMPGIGGGEMTIRIKGDKARIDATPTMSTIVDGTTGEITTLMMDQKKALRISAEKMKAAAEMINRFNDKKTEPASVKPKATGRKEIVNGYEAEEYTVETPLFKASYWLAPKYPDGAAILKQLQTVKSEIWHSANRNMPDYHDFPALPVRTVIELGNKKMTTTLVSVKQDPVNEADLAVPKDFQEIKSPDFGGMLQPHKTENGAKGSPHP